MVISEVSRDFQNKISLLEKQIETIKVKSSEKEIKMMNERENLRTEYDSMNKKTGILRILINGLYRTIYSAYP